ncbi:MULTISPECIES: glycosyltransferase [unclassified Halomonas]|uniref:glycosyltransferase n=1 Tax=unclassified Halomonas TaxID=2609666 RepID=UPI00288797D9|nr:MULTISPECIES: glycosyltransferase [unclassified Halomonas]MDT0511698.1 glycosyltransferase [Halomonas sp. LES1]MDT0590014.1 glycosyltransferase [Halomonas sp. PAR8]
MKGPRGIFGAWRRRRQKAYGRGGDEAHRLIAQSTLFDADWYRRQPGVSDDAQAARDPVGHYLTRGAAAGLAPGPGFDGAWYLARYPDVAEAGLNPLVHYLRHGQYEGRLPRDNRALAWEHHLWRGAEAVMVPRLERLRGDEEADVEERQHAAWALARWWAWRGEWTRVRACLLPEGRLITHPAHIGPALLAVEALCSPSLGPDSNSEKTAHLPRVLAELDRRFPEQANTALAHANALGDETERLAWINRIWRAQGLSHITRRVPGQPLTLDNLAADTPQCSPPTLHSSQLTPHSPPLVSVIVPVYNAASSIATALHSLFAQRGVALELLVVDDASSDDTWGVLQALVAECPGHVRLRLLRHGVNAGAYAARNTGLMAASGTLITTHDSDDWSHPEKLALQVAALEAAPEAMASLSHWVRATPALHFHRWRVEEEGWVYRNISSLMVRRAAVDALGGWDAVSVNADSEYHERLIAAFGEASVVDALPGVPLAFGRADAGSLSQSGATHLSTQFVGVRQAYMDAARRWHAAAESPSDLYLPLRPAWRPYAAPSSICRQALPVRSAHPLDTLQASELFDAGWYLRTHLDLQDTIIEPLAHYWQAGSVEGRDPGPHFSVSGYRYAYPDVDEQGQEALHHYLTRGRHEGRAAWPILPGDAEYRPGERSVLLCGHQAGHALYGAERSLLDVLKAMRRLGWNVVVCLPSAVNEAYVEALRAHARAVAVLPYGWWQRGRAPEPATLRHFRELIRRFGIEAVHANTLVLEEPLVAAREAGVPAVVHVRELPAHDAALCRTLNADAATLMRRVQEGADLVIANSRATATACEAPQHDASPLPAPPVRVVPNTVEMAPLLALPMRSAVPLAVGMLSSNLPKKGLEDLEAMARHLTRLAPDLRVVLFGPRTPALESLLARRARGLAPKSLVYGGYVDLPVEALTELDIVVSLSRFQESFGRTALEAMAAARPVVGYAWGALPELVEEGETGHLVRLGDAQGAARLVAALARDPERRARLGAAGRRRARERFGDSAMATALHQAYAALSIPTRPGHDDNSRSPV